VDVELDLRGVRCPLNWAHAMVRLENHSRGDSVTLILDDPKGVRDIPRAAEAQGYVAGEPVAGSQGVWRLTIWV
jgi:TusA-related sulfurtransferase